MEKALSSGAVFVSIVCGQPGALAALCIYLFALIVFLIMTHMVLSPNYRRSVIQPRRQPVRVHTRR